MGLNVGGGGGPALEALAREGDDASYKFPVPLRRRKDCDFSYAGLKTAVRLAIERDLGVGGVGADDGAFTKVYSRGGDSEEEEDEEEVDSDEDSNSSATTTTTRRRLPSPEEEDAATRRTRANIAASFQRVAVTHLTERTSRAVEWANDLLDDGETLSCVVVAGGVASNAVVRERLSEVASRCALPLVTPPPRWCVDNGVMVAWAGGGEARVGVVGGAVHGGAGGGFAEQRESKRRADVSAVASRGARRSRDGAREEREDCAHRGAVDGCGGGWERAISGRRRPGGSRSVGG